MSLQVSVGQKVKAKFNLIEQACGDHPSLLYAKEGDILIIRKINPDYPYPLSVSHEDVTDRTFACSQDEIEVV